MPLVLVLALIPGIKNGSNHRGRLDIYVKIRYLRQQHRGTAILFSFRIRRRLRVRGVGEDIPSILRRNMRRPVPVLEGLKVSSRFYACIRSGNL